MSLRIVPLTLRQGNEFIKEHHRHNAPVAGCKYAIGCAIDDELIGVAIAGRPVARHLDDGKTIEVTRVCTNGYPNACSQLYGAALGIAREMGYARAITYTHADEPRTSLRASGWMPDGLVAGRVTREEIMEAKRLDLLTCLQTYEPDELVKCGKQDLNSLRHALKPLKYKRS